MALMLFCQLVLLLGILPADAKCKNYNYMYYYDSKRILLSHVINKDIQSFVYVVLTRNLPIVNFYRSMKTTPQDRKTFHFTLLINIKVIL